MTTCILHDKAETAYALSSRVVVVQGCGQVGSGSHGDQTRKVGGHCWFAARPGT